MRCMKTTLHQGGSQYTPTAEFGIRNSEFGIFIAAIASL